GLSREYWLLGGPVNLPGKCILANQNRLLLAGGRFQLFGHETAPLGHHLVELEQSVIERLGGGEFSGAASTALSRRTRGAQDTRREPAAGFAPRQSGAGRVWIP